MLILSEQQSKTQRYLIHTDIKQRKAAIPFIIKFEWVLMTNELISDANNFLSTDQLIS